MESSLMCLGNLAGLGFEIDQLVYISFRFHPAEPVVPVAG